MRHVTENDFTSLFLKIFSTAQVLKRLEEIKKEFSALKIQDNFRNFQNKIKFYHKLYVIVNGIHRHVTEKLHRRFILWIRHLHYSKLSKGIGIIIELMRHNSNFKKYNQSINKIEYYASNCQKIFLQKFLNMLKRCSAPEYQRDKNQLLPQ
jgi:hypothetical protein